MISRRNSAKTLAVIALTAMFSIAPVQAENLPKVKLSTSMGDIVVQLDPAKAPKTVENFLQYVKDKHYDGTIWTSAWRREGRSQGQACTHDIGSRNYECSLFGSAPSSFM